MQSFCFSRYFHAFPQKETISGRITSAENGEAMSFVFVTVKGTNTGTLSDTLGRYSIDVQPDDLVLDIQMCGYDNPGGADFGTNLY